MNTFKKVGNNLIWASGVVGGLTLISRLVGLMRDRLFASHFGAGDILDVYYAAFRLPDFIFNLLILGTLSAAFLPVFGDLLIKDKRHAFNVASTILNSSMVVMFLLSVGLIIFTPVFAKMLVPGFDAEKLSQTIDLTRILLVSPVLFTLSTLISSILNVYHRFTITSLAPIAYNVGIIMGLLFLYPIFGMKGLAYGVIFGALLHLMVQLPSLYKSEFEWKAILNIKDAAVKKIFKLFVPKIFGLDAGQVSLLIASIIGSTLGTGSITVFNLASNVQAVPVGIFAVSVAIAAFPQFTVKYATKDPKGFLDLLSTTMHYILFCMLPATILILLLRAHIVRVLLGAGLFDWSDTIWTFRTLGVFSFSLFAQGLIPVLARAFYARQNTIIPVTVGLLCLFCNALFSYIFSQTLGVVGLAAGFTASVILNALVLFLILRYQLGKDLEDKPALLRSFDHGLEIHVVKVIIASIGMGEMVYLSLYALSSVINTHTLIGLTTQVVISVVAGGILFVWLGFILKIPQTKGLITILYTLSSKIAHRRAG